MKQTVPYDDAAAGAVIAVGDNMFAVVNAYTRASQFDGLSAENSYQMQRVGRNILGMLN